ncbi:MAG TPA: hypothetical protein VHO90_14990 [Bacteroidales bacterium]|nr:hypothetical protein [Bacteroidales bacterium]
MLKTLSAYPLFFTVTVYTPGAMFLMLKPPLAADFLTTIPLLFAPLTEPSGTKVIVADFNGSPVAASVMTPVTASDLVPVTTTSQAD